MIMFRRYYNLWGRMQHDEMWMLSRVKYGLSQLKDEKLEPVQKIVKTAKGTRDYLPQQMAIRRKVIDTVVDVFQKHSAVQIDTPLFELKEILTGKYGAESKLIYDLQDQGGEICSLRYCIVIQQVYKTLKIGRRNDQDRYDLTVPFARFMATHTNIQKIKRYHIAKVYRRDQPAFTRGRYRQFYQCDFDIAGKYDSMIPDAQVLAIVQQILQSLSISNFIVKINHRAFLQAIVSQSACSHLFKTICSSIDKLDKSSWAEVKAQLITKGTTEQQADNIGLLTQMKGSPMQLLNKLQAQNIFKGKQITAVYEQMKRLFKYLQALKRIEKVSFDLSLARGLDYYTGMIFEIVLSGENELGSVAGGGRYDNLIGMFSQHEIPSVGGSIGIERLFTLLQQKMKKTVKTNPCEVMVASIGKVDPAHKFAILSELWQAGIRSEMMYVEKAKPEKQIDFAFENQIPIVLWVGEDEINNHLIKIKTFYKYQEITVQRKKLIEILTPIIAQYKIDYNEGKVAFVDPKKKKENK